MNGFWIHACKAGTWDASTGKVTITTKDFDHMIEAFNATAPKLKEPGIRLGDHDTLSISAGSVGKLKRVGEDFYAYLVGVPEVVKKAIEKKLFKRPSIGFDRNRKLGEKTWAAVLDHIALLGWKEAAVSGLADLKTFLEREGLGELVELFEAGGDGAGKANGALQVQFQMSALEGEPEDKETEGKRDPSTREKAGAEEDPDDDSNNPKQEGAMKYQIGDRSFESPEAAVQYANDLHGQLQDASKALETKDGELKAANEAKTKAETDLAAANTKIEQVAAEALKAEVTSMVEQAVKDGKLSPKMKDNAIAMGLAMGGDEVELSREDGKKEKVSVRKAFGDLLASMAVNLEFKEQADAEGEDDESKKLSAFEKDAEEGAKFVALQNGTGKKKED